MNQVRESNTHSMHPRRYTFVTVGFEGDAGLLHLQARSMRLYCPPELIEEIIIIDNSSPGSKREWQSKLLNQYGYLASFVRIVPAANIAAMSNDVHGWFTQQVLKIEVSSIVRSERYVILDAKDHLVSRLEREFLETPEDQPRTNGHSYANHSLQEYLERTLEYLGLDPLAEINWFPHTDTPFTILRDEARDLVRHVEQKEVKPFASVFLERGLTEFFMYAGFLVSKGTLRQHYDITQPHTPHIWPERASAQDCADAIRKADQSGSPFMTVHRRAFAKMDAKGQTLMAEFWHKRGLFASAKDGLRFLRDPNRSRQHFDGRVVAWPIAAFVSRFRSVQ
jgi:hypothetical protein